MTDKPNTRPWDDPEDDEHEYVMAFLLARYPDVERDMALYESIMNKGASLAMAIGNGLHWLCTAIVMTHIRTPRWVKRVLFYGSAAAAGFTAAAGIMWLLVSLTL